MNASWIAGVRSVGLLHTLRHFCFKVDILATNTVFCPLFVLKKELLFTKVAS